MKKKRLVRKILFCLILVIVVVLFFASTAVRWYVQKNGEALVGRKVEVGELHLNYLKVSIDIKDFVLFEENKIDSFVSFNEFYVDIQPWRMINNEYSLKKFMLDGLFVQIEQNGSHFNFDDLIPASDTTVIDTTVLAKEEDTRFSFENVIIRNSNFNYLDEELDNLIAFHNLNLDLPLFAWNSEQADVGGEFNIGQKGHLHIDAAVNNEDNTYTIHTQIDSLDLNPFSKYTQPYLNTSELQGLLNSNLRIKGSMIDYMNVIVSGEAIFFDFILPDEEGTPIFSTQSAYVGLDSIDMQNQYFGLNKIELTNPRLWVENGKETTNIEHLIAPFMSVDTTVIADTSATISVSQPICYSVDTLIIKQGDVALIDASLNRPFNYSVSSLYLSMGRITECADSIPIAMDMVLNDKGSFNGNASFSMLNPESITFKGDVNNLELMSFSPYSEYYIAYPITQGVFNYNVEVEMTATELLNNNTIEINELDFGKKTADTTAMKTPIRLALYILKDKNDNINFDVPVWGNPSEPNFSIGKIVWKTFLKFMLKTATEPFSALASLAGTNPEDIQQINFELTQDTLSEVHRNTLNKLGDLLHDKPEFIFTLTQETPKLSEMHELAVKQIIVDYLLQTQQASRTSDTLSTINKWSNFERSNTQFIQYVNGRYGKIDDLPLDQKCLAIIGKDKIEMQFTELLAQRNKIIHQYLSGVLKVNEANFVVQTADIVNMRTQVEVPIFRIEVSMQ